MIYFDNAATSWPKPDTVVPAMNRFMNEVGANPGRSGHRLSVEAGRIINDGRENVAELFKVKDPMRVVFGINATDGLNLGIRGILRKGDHVITSSMEHNSVMRPLRELEQNGTIELTVVQCTGEGILDPDDVENAVRRDTRLMVLNHASNIVGTLLPVRQVGKIAHEHGAFFMIDAAQTGGCIPIDMTADHIDLLGFTGHKGLLGPQGTGGLVIGERVNAKDLRILKSGGTGSRSEFERQPDFLPDKYESGTMNTVGLAGLAAGVRFVLDETVERIHEKELKLSRKFIHGATATPGLTLYGTRDERKQTPTFSFNLEGMAPSEVGFALDEDYGIMCRVGLHCAPAAHRTIGTFPDGTVRFGFGYFTTEEEVDFALASLEEMTRRNRLPNMTGNAA